MLSVDSWLIILGSAVAGLIAAHFATSHFFADIDRRLTRIEEHLRLR